MRLGFYMKATVFQFETSSITFQEKQLMLCRSNGCFISLRNRRIYRSFSNLCATDSKLLEEGGTKLDTFQVLT